MIFLSHWAMVKLAFNQIEKVLQYVNCIQETLRGTKLLDEKFKELEQGTGKTMASSLFILYVFVIS